MIVARLILDSTSGPLLSAANKAKWRYLGAPIHHISAKLWPVPFSLHTTKTEDFEISDRHGIFTYTAWRFPAWAIYAA